MIKRIHWDVVLLIIKTVLENPKILRTPLAQKCNRNYQQLTNYLKFMQLVKIIILEEKNNKVFLKITEHGKDVFKNSKDYLQD